MRSFDPLRTASAFVLGAWATLFWFLLATDQTFLYLSPRTGWVVPLGGVLCTMGALGALASARRVRERHRLRLRDGAGLSLVVLPVVVVLALPPASLGAYAADRRSSFVASGYATSAADVAEGELTLLDVAGALRSSEAMTALSERAAEEVTFVGFVTRDSGMAADEFILTRFLLSCCVADALSVQVRVVSAPPGTFNEDDWVSVEGAMYPLGKEVIVDASEVTGVPRPKRPYLSP